MKRKSAPEALINNYKTSPGIEITFYTDPLCCWSWAMRPQIDRFLAWVGNPVGIRYKMAGLLPSWKHFNDLSSSISKPIQMGPEWLHARAISGTHIDDRIWITDPPVSSFPACIGVKAAEMQSMQAGSLYLYLLQEAVMTQCRNIARQEILFDAAVKCNEQVPGFDISKFKESLSSKEVRELFRRDMAETKYLNISRLPTIVMKKQGSAVMLVGYQVFDVLASAADRLVNSTDQ